MKILISNDDGYFAQGIETLAKKLAKIAEVVVVATEADRSGASNSLTVDRPLIVRKSWNGFFYVNGTPTDCVHLAVTGLLDTLPDMVVSGINNGANMGDDTIYSGTVAAATEGYLLGLPSLAISLASFEQKHYDTAAQVALEMVLRLAQKPIREPVLLNINVPDVPYDELTGYEVTRLGKRHKAQPPVLVNNPKGESMYWIGPAGGAADAGYGTDFFAVANGAVSVTPLSVDLTDKDQLPSICEWLGL
jgi:5'-nucleotidase